MDVYLVDGTYELFRTFYGAPSVRNGAGREVGACRALFASSLKLVRERQVTHIGFAFDHVIESFRNELFDGYKTGDGIDPDLWSQFELAERVTAALGFATWPMVEFEADDALATAAHQAAADARTGCVFICSPDKDLAQCVRGERVVTYDRLRDKLLTEDGVRAKFGVSPGSIPDYLALVGDTADGIPGVPGWGEKSASAVLAAYGRLEAIPTDAALWSVKVRGGQKLAETLRLHATEVLLYRRLATLRTDCPIDGSLAALEWRGPHPDRLAALEAELESEGLAERARQLWGARKAAVPA